MQLIQVLINTIVRASELGLLAIGITMIFSILKFGNFAQGEFALLGAYFVLLFKIIKLDFIFAVLISIFITGLIGILSDKLIFKRLRLEGTFTLLIASMGLSIMLRDIIRGLWGPDPLSYSLPLPKIFNLFGGRITSTNCLILILTALSMIIFYFVLSKTKLGKSMRATSDNPDLAKASGIDVDKVISFVWFITASFAALGGILVAMESLLWPEMGSQILLPAFVAAILGGIGSIFGAIIGSLIISFVENFGLSVNFGAILGLKNSFYINTGYKYAISFIILIIVLLIRPSGIFNRKTSRGD